MSREPIDPRQYETICTRCNGDNVFATIWWYGAGKDGKDLAWCDECTYDHSLALLQDVIAGGHKTVGDLVDDLVARASTVALMRAGSRAPWLKSTSERGSTTARTSAPAP